MGTLTINRHGRVHTDKSINSQCKDVGHRQYRYLIALTVPDTDLDEKGFIVDHYDIHGAVVKYVQKNGIRSCELFARGLSELMQKLCVKTKLHPYKIRVRVQPIIEDADPDMVAFMEHEATV